MAHSTADDVPGIVLLAAATTWAGQLADAALGVKRRRSASSPSSSSRS